MGGCWSGYKNKLFACEFAKRSETDISKLFGSTALVVGSEGGFSGAEAELAKTLGFSFITLGKRILRAETAATALTAIAMFSLGELGESEEKDNRTKKPGAGAE